MDFFKINVVSFSHWADKSAAHPPPASLLFFQSVFDVRALCIFFYPATVYSNIVSQWTQPSPTQLVQLKYHFFLLFVIHRLAWGKYEEVDLCWLHPRTLFNFSFSQWSYCCSSTFPWHTSEWMCLLTFRFTNVCMEVRMKLVRAHISWIQSNFLWALSQYAHFCAHIGEWRTNGWDSLSPIKPQKRPKELQPHSFNQSRLYSPLEVEKWSLTVWTPGGTFANWTGVCSSDQKLS